MSASCSVCSSYVTKGRSPGVKCGGPCERLFHIKCANIPEEMVTNIKNRSVNWLCEDCRSIANKSLIDCDVDTDAEPEISLSDIMKQLKRIEMKLSKLDEVQKSVLELKSEHDTLKSRVQTLEQQLSLQSFKWNNIEAENDKINQINSQCSITISGLPSNHGDIRELIVNTIEKVGVQIQREDILSIDTIHKNLRPGTSNNNRTNIVNSFQVFFIVKLKSIELTNSVLSLMLKKKSLSTNDLDIILPANHPKQRIFIMQRFTKFQSQLYREAKNIKTKFNFKYLWCKTGHIYLRKSSETEVLRIKSMNDIFRITSDNQPLDANAAWSTSRNMSADHHLHQLHQL